MNFLKQGSAIKYLDQMLNSKEELAASKSMILKIEKCCQAVDAKMNLADVVNDDGNMVGLKDVFGANFSTGMHESFFNKWIHLVNPPSDK